VFESSLLFVEDPVLEILDVHLELVDEREVPVHDLLENAVQDHVRASVQDVGLAKRPLPGGVHSRPALLMDRHDRTGQDEDPDGVDCDAMLRVPVLEGRHLDEDLVIEVQESRPVVLRPALLHGEGMQAREGGDFRQLQFVVLIQIDPDDGVVMLESRPQIRDARGGELARPLIEGHSTDHETDLTFGARRL